jgi:uncharacterized protein YggT (Ycf19 family)
VLWLILTAKLLVEVAAFALLGQLVLGWIIGQRRHDNLVYRLLQTVAMPVHRMSEAVSPQWVLAQHRPLVAVVLLCMAWLGLTLAKVVLCLNTGVARCLA